MDISNINYLAVVVATIASFALGALWYSPILFGKMWQKEVGFTEEDLKKGNMAVTMGGSFVMMLLMSFGLATMLGNYPEDITWLDGLYTGLFAGVAFAAAGMAINSLYQNRTLTLFAIDAGYQIVFLGLMGIVLGLWR